MKKGIAARTLIMILFLTIGFLVIASLLKFFFFSAEEKTAETICRASVAARGKEIINLGIKKVRTPLLCKSQSKDIGKDKEKDEVMKELANLMARCWWMYGEGLVPDVFKAGNLGGANECGICYILNMEKWKNGNIKLSDFLNYLATTTYKVKEETDSCKMFGGKCMTKEECDEKIESNKYFKKDDNTKCKKDDKICCYSPYDCLSKGGECLSELKEDYLEYGKWNCPFGECYIKKENYHTYLQYIQRYGGNGAINFAMDEEIIKPGETYAITFGSPTRGCGFCRKLGLSSGVVGGVGILTGVTLCSVGGCYVGLPLIKISAGILGVSALSYGTDLGIKEAVELFDKRDLSTIYFSKLNDAKEKCSILVD